MNSKLTVEIVETVPRPEHRDTVYVLMDDFGAAHHVHAPARMPKTERDAALEQEKAMVLAWAKDFHAHCLEEKHDVEKLLAEGRAKRERHKTEQPITAARAPRT